MEGSSRGNLNIALFPTLMDLSKRTVGSVSTQEHDTSIKETRRMIFECMKNLLGDSHVVQQQLLRDTEGTSQPFVVLQFVHHCVCVLPQCFVSCNTSYDRSPTTPKEFNISEIYHATPNDFTTWVIAHLLHILSSPGCLPLHAKTLEIVVAIMQLAKAKDNSFFQRLSLNFVLLMQDINTVGKKHNFKLEKENMEESVVFRRFCERVERNNFPSGDTLKVSSTEECVLLQKSISMVFKEMIPAVCQFAAFAIEIVWRELTFVTQNYPKDVANLSRKVLAQMCIVSGDVDTPSSYELAKGLLEELKEYVDSDETARHALEDGFWMLWDGLMPLQPFSLDRMPLQRKNCLATLYRSNFQDILDGITTLMLRNPHTLSNQIAETIFCAGRRCLHMCYANEIDVKGSLSLIEALYHVSQRFHGCTGLSQFQLMAVAVHLMQEKPMNVDAVYAKKLGHFLVKTHARLLEHICDVADTALKDENFIQTFINQMVSMCALLSMTHVRLMIQDMHPIKNIDPLHLCKNFSVFMNILKGMEMRHELSAITYSLLVQVMSHLLDINQEYRMFSFVLAYVMDFVSLPWETTKEWKLHEWKPRFEVDYCKFAQMNELAPFCTGACARHVLGVLMRMPPNNWDSWRCRIFKYFLMSQKPEFVTEAIRAVPAFVVSLDSKFHQTVVEDLKQVLDFKTNDVQFELVKSFGDLVCALSCLADRKRFDVDKTINSGKGERHMYLRCRLCEDGEGDRESVADPFISSVIQNLSSLQPKTTKMEYICSISALTKHVKCHGKPEEVSQFWKPYLDLITDPEYTVRIAVSKEIKHFLTRNDLHKVQGAIVNKLKETLMTAVMTKDVQGLETTCLTLGNLGKLASGDLSLVTIISLLECQLTKIPFVSTIAFEQVQDIASAKGISSRQLFDRFRTNICGFLVSKFHEQLLKGKKAAYITDAMSDVAAVFDFKNTKSFLQHSMKHILPKVVHLRDPSASQLLRNFANNLDMNRREMLLHNFKYVFPYLVCFCAGSELEESLNFLQKETDVELHSLLRSECQNTFNNLMLHLCNYREEVFTGLSILACSDSSYSGTKELRTDRDRALYIHSRLLGALPFFNQVLTYGEECERLLVIKTLAELPKIMGPSHITPVRLKVMAILCLGMKREDEQFLEASCNAWDSFVRNVELSALGPMLCQIIVTLMPLLEKFPDKVSSIFRFLLVENKDVMQEYFGEIYFMPEIPILKDVTRVLMSKKSPIKSSKDFKMQLLLPMKGIKHENNDVRKYALKRTAELLQENQDYLIELILGSETVDPVVVKLIGMLIGCSKGADADTRNLIGICFGEIGAVDPGRLENLSGEKEEDTLKSKSSVRDKDFAVDLINELCHAFLAAGDTGSQDCSAYAIQEILHFYDCKNANPKSNGYQIWHQFPMQIQEILQPHLHSKYVHSSRNKWSNISVPVFGSEKGRTFKEWICNLVGFQISKVKDRDFSAVFTPCLSIIKYDLKTALFIFPHVLSHCITESSTAADEILSEVLSVLDAACCQERDIAVICAQTIFTLVDFLEQSMEREKGKEEGEGSSQDKETIKNFLQKIPKDLLAKAAFNCKSNSRALMYFENYVGNDTAKLQNNLRFLQELYFALNEPDGISGIAAVRKGNKSLQEQITEHESSGRLLDAAACYERAIQLKPDTVTYYQGLLQSLIGLGQLNSALMNANGVITQRRTWADDLRPYQAEAAWRLGRWDDLRENLEPEGGYNNWSIALGKLLLNIKHKNAAQFQDHLEEARKELMTPVCAASLETGAYERAYESVLRLHMLQEVEHCSTFVMSADASSIERVQELTKRLELRYTETQDSFRIREPLLNLRRILVDLLPRTESTEQEKDNCWIRIAKIARKAGHYSTAFSSLLNVVQSVRPDTVKEHAKLLWAQGDCHQALMRLQKGLSEIETLEQSGKTSEKFSKLSMAKVRLLIGQWMEETESYEPEPVLYHYKGIVESFGDWEKGHFYLAKYYERLMNACEDEPTKMRKPDFVKFVVRHYAMSLQYGNKWIYQSMPKLLSLWLDFGMKAWTIDQERGVKHSEKAYYREKLQNVNEAMAGYSKTLPPYQFLTAFSQLISRICHPNPIVWNLLEEVISRLLITYRQQAIWNMVSVAKSSFKTRSLRCHQIFANASKRDAELKKFIEDVIHLTDRLLEICNKKVEREQKLSLSKDFATLKRMLADRSFSSIIIPLQSTMTVILPSGSGNHRNFSPFPESLPFFSSIEDSIGVLHSLQKPKKIMIRGSDGSIHPMMCKPKDDLRKDCRLMEFNSLVNKLLLKDADCRRRQLHIRTYAVIPLNEECGVLEWVQNTTGLRHILNQLYKEKGILMKVSELKRIYDAMNASDNASKARAFQSQVIPRHPPVFQDWFVRSFPTPSKWYMARLAYCRTCAVISMVGYTLGLGDRHGENILFDSTTGDCVHVDFNCLFNKGETFDYPEKVPFRLTHNMIAAMGPLGYEGIYRRACEVTLKLMRNQRDSLLSVLHSFLYDPLVEWTKERRKQVTESGEVTNEKAVKILKDIEQRLRGYYSGMTIRLPLSIEGHVHQLIKEATDLENLSQMYIGWAAYL